MKKLVVIAALAASLGGCATQFGTRIAPSAPAPAPNHHRIITKAPQPAPAPVVVQAPVAPAPVPTPAPEAPKTFWERHPIQWLHH